MRKVALAAFLIGLMTISNLPKPVMGQTSPWIDQTKATQYAMNMVDSYNNLTRQRLQYLSNFTSYKQFLSLYGGAFNVLVVRSVPGDDNGTTFVFISNTTGGGLHVSVNNTLTRDALLPDNASLQASMLVLPTPYGFAYEDVSTNLTGTIEQIPLVWSTATWSVLADNASIYSKDAAVALLANDEQVATKSYIITNPTQTSTISTQFGSSTQTSVASGSSNLHTLWILLGGIFGTIAVASGVIVAYFGSIREFVKVLGSPRKRREVLQELRQLRKHKVEKAKAQQKE